LGAKGEKKLVFIYVFTLFFEKLAMPAPLFLFPLFFLFQKVFSFSSATS